MIQLKAGYFTNAIETLKTNDSMKKKVDSLTEQLSYFELDSNIDIKDDCEDASVALIYNMVSRGTPAYVSQFVEDILSTTIGKTHKKISDNGNITREIAKREVKEMVFKALHIIDPRVKAKRVISVHSKEQQVYDFIKNGAVPVLGDYIFQLAETKRDFDKIFEFSKNFHRRLDVLKNNPNYMFLNEKCDLCFSAPYSENTKDCVTFAFNYDDGEVDTTDYITEDCIKELLNSINVDGRVIVRKNDNPYDKTEELSYFSQSPYFDIIRDNYNSPLYNSEDGIEALQIALTPLAIARIQKVLLEAINSGALNLSDKIWKIGVIERDVPCGFLAIEDLKQHFNNFFQLENCDRKFPTVKLDIFYTEEFAETELNLLYQGNREDVTEFDSEKQYDLLIDISVLKRVSFENEVPNTKAKKYAVIRSAKSPRTNTKLLFNNYIHYDIDLKKEDEEDFNEQEESLRYFLKNLFAKNEFLKGQAESISQLLNGNNILQVSAPGTGKTLVTLFTALMKPGYSFVLSPTLAVMDMQFDTLRHRNIDIDYYINPALQNSLDRYLAVQDVINGRSIITFLSPSLIHDPYIRNVFKQIDNKNIPIYFIMLDEAQRISLQTSEYRAYYQDIKNIIAKNFNDEYINTLRIGAFTSVQETNIQNEIAEKLQIDNIMVVKSDVVRKINLTVHEITMNNAGNTDLTSYSRKMKQVEAEKIITNEKTKDFTPKTIIFSAQSPFDKQTPESDNYMIAGLESDYYLGDIVELDRPITASEAVSSMKATKNFCNDKSYILSATQNAGIGIHVNNLSNIIHFEPPLSLDAFCRMNGRGATTSSNPKIDLFINTVEKDFSGYESVRDEKGNLKTAENVIITNFDTANNLQRLLNQNPGPDKEKIIINEILNGVIFPQYSDRQTVIDAVYNEFNIEIDTDTEPSYNPYQLYIYTQQRNKSLGFINFKTNELNMPEMQYDKELALKIQTFIFDLINDNTENPLEFLSTMETERISEENDGIQTALDAIMEGNSANVTVPFYNNSFYEATELINNQSNANITVSQIRRCYNHTMDFTSFEKLLAKEYEVRTKNLSDKKHNELIELYTKFRNQKDTLRAITRLKEIDIIDDYQTNSAKGEVIVSLTKHNKDFYKMKLLPILQRNLTKEKTLLYISSIEEEKFLNIEKYSNVLIDFFYTEIYPLYERAAKDSSKFFETILKKQKDGTLSQDMIQKNLQNYFVSRYKCKFVCDEIPDNTANVSGIIGIINRAGSNINELASLQDSMEQSIPENRTPSNKIIYGYCKIFTGNTLDEENRYNAYEIISEGLSELRQKESIKDFLENMENITEKICDENYDLKDESEEILTMKVQHQWLKWFNSNVLKTEELNTSQNK